jgi:hypothetical protein
MKNKSKKSEYYAFVGAIPSDWSEVDAMGPFRTIKEAEEEIKKDAVSFVDNCEEPMKIGDNDEILYPYTIVKAIKKIKPIIKVSARIDFKEE